jgi:hypothetical protein
MTENSPQQSATIYQFPVRARRTDSTRQESSVLQSAPAAQLAPRAAMAGGSGWYHEAAIEEAKEEAKHARDH